MNEINFDFAIRERAAQQAALHGNHLLAGLLMQDIIVIRDLMAQQQKGKTMEPEKEPEPAPAPTPEEPPAPAPEKAPEE